MCAAGWHGGQAMSSAPPIDDDLHQLFGISGINAVPFDLDSYHAGQSLMSRCHTDMVMADSDSSAFMIHQHDSLGMLSSSAPIAHASEPASSMYILDTQTLHHQQKQHAYQGPQDDQTATFFPNHVHSVPSTPQSLEMPSSCGKVFAQNDQPGQAVYDNRAHSQSLSKKQDMVFTPLVSPAVTPLDSHFNMNNAFAVPGSYFSPLTSPALHAQHDVFSIYDLVTQSKGSLVEMDLELPGPECGAQNHDLSRKTRKSAALKTRAKANIKSSPIAKPQRRRIGPSQAMVSQVLSEVEERDKRPSDQALLHQPATSTDSSEDNASVSPETITDMPPPPVPHRRSTSKSSFLHDGNGSARTWPLHGEPERSKVGGGETQAAHPATPASLMRLAASKGTRPRTSCAEQSSRAENTVAVEPPEALTSGGMTPIMGNDLGPLACGEAEATWRKRGGSQALPSPAMNATDTASSMTQNLQTAVSSSGQSSRKPAQAAGRNSRARSMGSVQASPALLPKISLKIRPLLAGTSGLSAEERASRLLTCKSNYQNIVEGNSVPGVNYPSELSTILTSKRTSHKMAEQGRRNRINSALQVMAGLIPGADGLEEGEDLEEKEAKQGNVTNSKASVVEKAIVHMKKLQKANVDLKEQVQELKRQLERAQRPSTDCGTSC